MNIQFDWRFDEDNKKQVNGATNAHQFSRRTRSSAHVRTRPAESSVDVIRPAGIVGPLAGIYARLRHRRHQMGLTASQRRLHAALARTRAWLCPDALPELIAPSFDWREQVPSIIWHSRQVRLLRCICAYLKPRPNHVMLTARQRRLHAALARIRPWSCPDALWE